MLNFQLDTSSYPELIQQYNRQKKKKKKKNQRNLQKSICISLWSKLICCLRTRCMVNSGNCLFRVTKLTTNYDSNKYGYSGCGIEFDVCSNFS